jgi:hypothetical protein
VSQSDESSDTSSIPPLALLAAVAALVHLGTFRVLLPVLASKQHALPPMLLDSARFALNLAACAGLLALAACAFAFWRAKELASQSRRLLVLGLAGMLLSTLAFATFGPEGHLTPRWVLLATGATHAMSVQLAMAALRVQRSLSGRTTAGLIAAASLFPLTALLLRHWDSLGGSGPVQSIATLHGLGELAYLLVPIAAAFVVVPWSDDAHDKRSRTLGAVAVGVMGVLFAAAARLPDVLYGHILYMTLRLEWALEKASLGYAVPVSLAAGAAIAAATSNDSRHRQGGAGLMLWLAAGYNPLTPSRLLMAALGVALLCRAIVGLAWGAPEVGRSGEPIDS